MGMQDLNTLTPEQRAVRSARRNQVLFKEHGCEYFPGWQSVAERTSVVRLRGTNWAAEYVPGVLGRTVPVPDECIRTTSFEHEGQTYILNPRVGEVTDLAARIIERHTRKALQ